MMDATLDSSLERKPCRSQRELDEIEDKPWRPEPSNLDVVACALVYNDLDFCVLDKPADVRMDGDFNVTSEKLMQRYHPLDPSSGDVYAHCHRLDFATSGCVLYAKRREAAAAAGLLFETRRVAKSYLALLHGHITSLPALPCVSPSEASLDGTVPDFVIDVAIGNVGGEAWHMRAVPPTESMNCEPVVPAKEARTILNVVAHGSMHGHPITKVVLSPLTGRRHQLRVHCAYIGHPIVGDVSYSLNTEVDLLHRRMMLHAHKIDLDLPWLASGALAKRSHRSVHRWLKVATSRLEGVRTLSAQSNDPFVQGTAMDDLQLHPFQLAR